MRFLLVFLSLFLCTSCYNVERNCQDFKNGSFEFEQLLGTEIITSTFTRQDGIAIEHFQNKVDTFSVRWINECEYIMRKLHPKTPYDEEALHFKILSTTKDTYTFEYKMVVKKENQAHTVKKGTVRKVK
ncbi:MAG: hypothetical protein ACSHW7_07165 [Patiriisocius sp.]|uniref:hypothetical protein n=1 Tax=Patiriisocius sp. TaxID=2822396 RepID=UPI003EF180D9